MISYEKAMSLILGTVRVLGPESISLSDAAGRVLARALKARLDLPRYDQSAMDGIAVRMADLGNVKAGSSCSLVLEGELPAGCAQRPRLRPGSAMKVFTGSLLPRGADAVVMKEYCRIMEGLVFLERIPSAGDHIRYRGEELRRGRILFNAGQCLTPATIGLLASNGIETLRVVARPRVAIITIGDELLKRGEPLAAGKIRDANGPALKAALMQIGVTGVRRYQVKDDPAALRRTLTRAIQGSDLVLTVGGASVGDHDHVAAVREYLGVRDLFDRVAIKPGKPTIFGHAPDGTPVFGLPGNPVSALVSFQLFVKAVVRTLQGLPADGDLGLKAELATGLTKKAGRLEWVRGAVSNIAGNLVVAPTRGQGSHMLSGLAAADVLIEFPADSSRLESGATVGIRMLG